ncbi:MAG: DUF3560 domain-containing protein [Defluviitaleaceae bacterium]|nr:DUF3560 domain-containing protein [Defluviitaleaceae bacterium]
MYNEINETAARRAKEANSYRDYKEGSATSEYRAMVDEAKEIAERQKQRVDPMHHEKIDRLLARYCAKLAANFNKSFEIDARVPSIMIAGPSNFPVRKKEKQNAARDRNMEEYRDIQGILDKIKGIGTAGISSDDPNAIDKLKEKLESLENSQAAMKAVNAYYRKHGALDGCPDLSNDTIMKLKAGMSRDWRKNPKPFESYSLSNNNAEIRRIKKRIEDMERRIDRSADGWDFDGGSVVINKEVNRLQIIFDAKPDEELRAELKSNGFRWAPSQNAWQRQYTDNALYAVKRIKAVSKRVEADNE